MSRYGTSSASRNERLVSVESTYSEWRVARERDRNRVYKSSCANEQNATDLHLCIGLRSIPFSVLRNVLRSLPSFALRFWFGSSYPRDALGSLFVSFVVVVVVFVLMVLSRLAPSLSVQTRSHCLVVVVVVLVVAILSFAIAVTLQLFVVSFV